jgi:hypothetical protein
MTFEGYMRLSSNGREVLFCEGGKDIRTATSCGVIELATGATRSLEASISPHPGAQPENLRIYLATQGPAVAMLGNDGSVRVGLRSVEGALSASGTDR